MRALRFHTSFFQCVRSPVRDLFPIHDVVGDGSGRADRGLGQLQIGGKLPLYALTLVVKEIVQVLEFQDHVLQLGQRDAGNPLNEGIDVRTTWVVVSGSRRKCPASLRANSRAAPSGRETGITFALADASGGVGFVRWDMFCMVTRPLPIQSPWRQDRSGW